MLEYSKLAFNPSLKFLTDWIKYECYFLVGQVNDYGKPHGICRMIDKNGLIISEGQFVNGKLSGIGRQIWPNGYYIGDYKDGRFHGFGTFVYDDGSTYVGAWKDYDRHGPGKLIKADGTVFEGNFVKNKLNGVYYNDL